MCSSDCVCIITTRCFCVFLRCFFFSYLFFESFCSHCIWLSFSCVASHRVSLFSFVSCFYFFFCFYILMDFQYCYQSSKFTYILQTRIRVKKMRIANCQPTIWTFPIQRCCNAHCSVNCEGVGETGLFSGFIHFINKVFAGVCKIYCQQKIKVQTNSDILPSIGNSWLCVKSYYSIFR